MASYELLKKIAQEAIDHLDDLNLKYPNIASDTSVDAVDKWRKKVTEFETTTNKVHSHTSRLEINSKEETSHDGSLNITSTDSRKTTISDSPEMAPEESGNNADDKMAALRGSALALLEKYDFDDVLDKMASQHDCNMNGVQLVSLVGQSAYCEALKREIVVLSSNAITNDQAANLWNSLGRPSLYGGAWCGDDISKLTS
jgi:hypothetical protein